ncbi:MAG: hypothetical protein LUH23_09245 [Oscillospiraceae bacterium]|nr:hypothetical protein [Oscillospiraceae bacterium]
MGYVILIITAILTQYIIAWAGGMSNRIGFFERKYTTLKFSDDRNLPMTTNILMNIFMPNVILVFLYLLAQKYFPDIANERLMIYTVSYYLYRLILICVISEQKELYSPKYEFCLAVVGTAISFVLCKWFLLPEHTILLTMDEIRVELWLAIALIVYKFGKQVLDKKVTQNDILSKKQIEQYIIHKFEKFYKKYSDLFQLTAENRYLNAFTFAVMIMENRNRSALIRCAENVKVRFGIETTVGIMQWKSKKPMSNEETIIAFLGWANEKSTGKYDISKDEEFAVYHLAWKYNNRSEYAENVLYIYNYLCEYIEAKPKYREAFRWRDDNDNGTEDINERIKGQMEVIQWMTDNPNATPEQAMQEFGIWG